MKTTLHYLYLFGKLAFLSFFLCILSSVNSLYAQHKIPTIFSDQIRPGSQSSKPSEVTDVNGKLFFIADGSGGIEPYSITFGPARVADIFPNGSTSDPYNLTALGSSVYFFASDGVANKALWTSIGANNINLVLDMLPGGNPKSNYLTAVGGRLYYSASSANETNEELWQSDGSTGGTSVIDINSTSASTGSYPENFTEVTIATDTYLFFTADNSPGAAPGSGGSDRELYYLQVGGTSPTKVEINAGAGSNPVGLTSYGGWCYFFADDGSGYSLWRSNGVTLTEITVGGTVDTSVQPVVSGSNLFFAATTAGAGTELWKYDGTTASQVLNIASGSASSSPDDLVDVDGTLYFLATTSSFGRELWKSDGTTAEIDYDVIPGANSSDIKNLTNVSGRVYFFAKNPIINTNFDIHYSDPDEDVRALFFDFTTTANIGSGFGGTDVGWITEIGEFLYFVAEGMESTGANNKGLELWRAEGCATVTMNYNTSSGNVLCAGSGSVAPVITGVSTVCSGGNCFSSTSGLVVDANTGEIDLVNSSAGSYEVNYNYADGDCIGVVKVDVTIQAKVAAELETELVAGNGSQGSTNSTLINSNFNFQTLSGDVGSNADDANISLAFSPDGSKLYIADEFNHCIRELDLVGDAVTTLAGSPGSSGSLDGTGTAARFFRPSGIDVDAAGNIYVADKGNHIIRRIDPATGAVTTIAGVKGSISGGYSDNVNSLLAEFSQPTDVVVASDGSLFISDKNNHKIRQMLASGEVTTFAGADQGFADGTGTAAEFNYPSGIDIDAGGNLYVADRLNHRIRQITSAGVVTTLAGGGSSGSGISQQDVDGALTTARFYFPVDVSVTTSGKIFIADRSNHKIKVIEGSTVSTYAGSIAGYNEGPALNAEFEYPVGVLADLTEECYILDKNNQRIRRTFINNPAGDLEGSAVVCGTSNTGTLTLTGYSGEPDASSILRWESSTDGGSTWTDIGNTGSATYNYTDIAETTLFRVIVQEAVCGELESNMATISTETPPDAVTSSAAVCGDGVTPVTVTITASGAEAIGGDYVWYDNTMTVIPGETTNTLMVNVATTTTYHVAIDQGGCEGNTVSVDAEVISVTDPVVADVNNCGPGVVTLTATGATTGFVYRWYDATGTTLEYQSTSETDNTFDTPNLTATTSYQVASYNPTADCEGNRVTVQAIIDAVPADPITSDITICGGGSATFTANGATAGHVYRWYDSAGITVLYTSTDESDNAFTPSPDPTTTTTYQVSIYNPATTCESSLVPVQVDVNTTSAAPTTTDLTICDGDAVTFTAGGATTGFVYRWYDSAGTTLLYTSSSETDDTFTPAPVPTTTTSYQVSIYNPTTTCESSLSVVQVTVNPVPVDPTSTDITICDGDVATLTASGATAGFVYRWYDSAGTTLLYTSADETDDTFAPVPAPTTTTSYQVSIYNPTTTCESGLIAVQVNVNTTSTIPTTTDIAICNGDSAMLTAGGATAGFVYRWYDSAGTTLLYTSADETDDTFTPVPAPTTTTNYQVSIYNPTTMCESGLATIQVTVNPVPSDPAASDVLRCGDGVVVLSATGATTGFVYRWYDSATPTPTLLKTSIDENDNTFTTPSLTTTTSYQVVIYNPTTGCESNLVSVDAIVNPLPATPGTSDETICSGNPATLTATGALTDEVYRWYDSAGTTVEYQSTDDTDNTYSPSPTATTTYQVSIYNTVTDCESSLISVQVTVNTTSADPTVNDENVCDTENVIFTASGAATGFVYQWYDATGTTMLYTSTDENDSTFTPTPAPTTTTTYQVSIVNNTGGCESNLVPVDAIIHPTPTPNVTGVATICETNTETYTTPSTANTFNWTVTGGNITSGQGTNTIDVEWTTSGAGIVEVEESNAGCAITSNVNVTVNPAPTPVINGGTTVCENDTQTYDTPLVTGNTYTWTVTGGLIGGLTTVSGVDINSVDVVWGSAGAGTITLQEEMTSTGTGCNVTTPVSNITIIAPPNTDITGANVVCQSDIETYQAAIAPSGQTYEYTWSVSGGTVTGGQSTDQAEITWDGVPNGTEYVQVTISIAGTACEATTPIPADPGSFSVTLNAQPDPVITTTTNGLAGVCENSTHTYETSLVTGNTYTWTVIGGNPVGGTGGIISGVDLNSIDVIWGSIGTGTITLEEEMTSLGTGCIKEVTSDDIIIDVTPGTVTTSSSRFVCISGSDLTLTAEEATADTYRWYDTDPATGGTPLSETGNTLITDPITADATYWVASVNAGGCEGPAAAITIDFEPTVPPMVDVTPTITFADSCVTSGDSPSGRIELEVVGENGPYTFEWTKVGDAAFSSNSQDLSGITQGLYSLVVTDDGGCVTDAGTFLMEEQLKLITDGILNASLAPVNDTVYIAQGDELTLTASATDARIFEWFTLDANGAVTILQEDALTENGTENTASYTFNPTESGWYSVTIKNDRNCDVTLSVYVEAIPLVVFVPNIFSPNGDQNNDELRVYGTGIKSIQFRIFNRLGELIYETSDWDGNQNMSNAWDGTFNGKVLQNGNYVWHLTGTYINDTEISFHGRTTGNVLLMR